MSQIILVMYWVIYEYHFIPYSVTTKQLICIIYLIYVEIYFSNLGNRLSSWKNVLGILVSVKETSTCVTQQNQNYSQRDLSV